MKGLQDLEIGDWDQVPIDSSAGKGSRVTGQGGKTRKKESTLETDHSHLSEMAPIRENEDFGMSAERDEDERVEYVEKDSIY